MGEAKTPFGKEMEKLRLQLEKNRLEEKAIIRKMEELKGLQDRVLPIWAEKMHGLLCPVCTQDFEGDSIPACHFRDHWKKSLGGAPEKEVPHYVYWKEKARSLLLEADAHGVHAINLLGLVECLDLTDLQGYVPPIRGEGGYNTITKQEKSPYGDFPEEISEEKSEEEKPKEVIAIQMG